MGWLDALARKTPGGADVAAQMALAYDASSRGDYARALEIWGPLAQAGVPRAQNNVGACFSEALGVERDGALAAKWLTLAAEGGDVETGTGGRATAQAANAQVQINKMR